MINLLIIIIKKRCLNMNYKVNLEEVIEALEIKTRESNYFYYKKTGEIFYITDDELREAEDEPNIDNFPEWQQDNIRTAVDILSTSDYIKLPNEQDIDDYRIMKDFCNSIEDEKQNNVLCDAISGSRPFRRFKEKIYQFDLADDWYDYQDKIYKEIAIEWCRENNIEYEENKGDKNGNK